MTDEDRANTSPGTAEDAERSEGTATGTAVMETIPANRKARSTRRASKRISVHSEKGASLEQLEFGFISTARTALEALALFRPADLRDDPEAVKSFSALVVALCRLGQATLNVQEYRDDLECEKRSAKQSGKGLPEALVKVIHEQLRLL
jgi:hypothetical protein